MASAKVYVNGAWVRVGGGEATVNISASEPSSPILGQLWLDTDENGLISQFTTGASNNTLPATPTAGDIYELVGDGTVWTITAYTGQYIRLLSNESSVAGSVSGQTGWESIKLVYVGTISLHPTWNIMYHSGTVILS